MATPQAIQLAADAANTMNIVRIQQSMSIDATYDAHFTVGITAPYAGYSRWCQTTKADSAADQAVELLAALIVDAPST